MRLLLPSSQVYSHDLPAGGMSWHQLLARPAAGLCAHMLYGLLGGLFVPPQRASATVEGECEHQWWSVLGSWAASRILSQWTATYCDRPVRMDFDDLEDVPGSRYSISFS